MILNSYAVLMAFVASIRLLLGLFTLGLGTAAWRAAAAAPRSSEARSTLEDRCYLLFLLALLLITLNLVSWPLLYLLLQSYVPEWPGVMCIYGVTRIGEDSLGPAAFLPGLLTLMQLTRPALVFAGGAWFVLYLLNRQTQTAPLLGRLLLLLLPVAALAVADAAADLVYLGIPKQEEFPTGGCCTAAFGEGTDRFQPTSLWGEAAHPWLWAGFYGGNLALILALVAATRPRLRPEGVGMGLLLLLGVGTLAAGALFLVEIAAPRILQLPYHHCPYDLIPEAPESVVTIVLFLGGFFFLGWAAVVRGFGRVPETQSLLPGTVQGLLRLSLWSYLASLAMLSLELALA